MKLAKNFTLIEMLIVVAIIGILASILLPSLAKAKKKAIIVVCTSQIRQLALGQNVYCNDFNGFFPDTEGPGYSKHNWGWAGNTDRWGGNKATARPINPYVADNITDDSKIEVLECPTDENPNAYNKYGEGKYSWYKVFGTSYSINKAPMRNSLGNSGSDAPQSMSEINEPSRMVMALENHAVNVFQGLPESDTRDWNINTAHNVGEKKYTNMIRSDLSALVNKRIYRRENRNPNWYDEDFTIENDD